MKIMKFVKGMKKDMKKSTAALQRFAQFNAVGALGIGVQLTVLWVLVDLWGVAYPLATALAVTLAVVHNFAWHQRWTWSDRRGQAPAGPAARLAFARFLGINGVTSIVGNVGLMFLLVEIGGANALIANAVAIAACGLVNFAVSDQFVFQA